MLPVAAVAVVGWLLLFVVLLAAPPSSRPRLGGHPGDDGPPEQAFPGDEPPAVVSLLAGQLGKYGFGATLADLAARGWFRLSAPGGLYGPDRLVGPDGLDRLVGPGGADGPGGPVICVVSAEVPPEPLTPFERRVVAHVALRAGARGEVPAPALSDGFEGGEAEFMKAFGDEVDTDARQRGLTSSRLSPGRIALLCLLLLVPAGALLPAIEASSHHRVLAFVGLAYFVLSGFTIKIGTSRRCSAAGRAALRRWRAAAAAAGGGSRLEAYAAALGTASAAVAVFTPAGKNVVWSGYRGSWQQLPVEKNTWPWPRAVVFLLAIIFGPVLYFAGVLWLFAHGMAGLAERAIGLVVAAVVVFLAWMGSRNAFPRFAEFDGQVVRQTFVKGGDDSPDEYHVVVDDGVRATAWDFSVGSVPYRRLTPGTFVHVRVNLRSQDQVSVEPVEPPAVVRQLADVAAEQQRAARGGLPDPATLVTADDAAYVLGAPVTGEHILNPAGQTLTWQPTGRAEPVLRIVVRKARQPLAGQPMPPGAWPVPGVAGGYLLDASAWLHLHPFMVIISIRGRAAAGNEASLAWLLTLTEGRLRQLLDGSL